MLRHVCLAVGLLAGCAPSAPDPVDTDRVDTDWVDTDGADTRNDLAYADTDSGRRDTDAADTDPVDTDAADTDPADTDAADTDPVDTDAAADTDPVDTDAADTDPVDTDGRDTDPSDTHAPDTGPVDTAAPCLDPDGDGYGLGCAAGPDCDEAFVACNEDCADLDGDLIAECAQPAGQDVLLYNGNGGGTWDIYEGDLVTLYAGVGTTAVTSAVIPPDLPDTYGVLMVLSPTWGFPDPTLARALLLRGGTVVVSVEHGGFGDPLGASAWLAALGSTMSASPGSLGGNRDLTVTPVPGVTDGVSTLRLFYAAPMSVGDGVALGVQANGSAGIGWERVGRGGVLLVPDGSFFGYVLYDLDNEVLLRNLAP